MDSPPTLRRSTRKRPSAAVPVTPDVLDDDIPDELRPAKRARTSTVKGRAKGKRKNTANVHSPLQELPIELIHEILSHLATKELVNIITLCRPFYSILANNSEHASKLWRNARAHEYCPVPEPPAGMSEVQWAQFIYGTECQTCGASQKNNRARVFVLFSLKRRVCKSCMSNYLIRGIDRPTSFINKLPFAHIATLELMPPSDKTLTGIVTLTNSYWNSPDIRVVTDYYWRPDISKMCKHLANEFPDVFFSEIAPSESPAYLQWAEMRKKEIQGIIEHAYRCCVWQQEMEKHTRELKQLEADRLAAEGGDSKQKKLAKTKSRAKRWSDEDDDDEEDDFSEDEDEAEEDSLSDDSELGAHYT